MATAMQWGGLPKVPTMKLPAVRTIAIWGVVALAFYAVFFRLFTTQSRGRETTIEWWVWGNYERLQNLYNTAAAFEKSHPHIRVKVVPIVSGGGTSTSGKIEVAIATHTCGDVLNMHYLMFPTFAYLGAFLDITPYVERDKIDFSDFFPIGIEAYTQEGTLYGLPLWGNTFCLVYNKDIFDEAGYPYPDETWTFDDLMKATQALTRDKNGDGKIDQYGCHPYEFQNFLWSGGGDMIDEAAERSLLDTPESVEATRFYTDLFSYKIGFQELINAWELGQVAMYITGPWTIADWDEKRQFSIGIAPFPMGKLGRVTRYSGIGVVIWSETKHPEEAWEFAKFYISKQGLEMALFGDEVPARRSLAYSPIFLKPGVNWDLSMFIKSLEGSQPHIPPKIPEGDEVSMVLNQAISEIRLTDMDVETAMRKASAKITEILGRRTGGDIGYISPVSRVLREREMEAKSQASKPPTGS